MGQSVNNLKSELRKLVREEAVIKSLLIDVRSQICKLKVESMHNSNIHVTETLGDKVESNTNVDESKFDLVEEINQQTLNLEVRKILAENLEEEEEDDSDYKPEMDSDTGGEDD